MKRKSILATTMLSMALAMGLGGKEGNIKKATQINRNWKEDQSKDNKLSLLEKSSSKKG